MTVTETTLGALEERAQQRTGAFGEHALIVCDSLVRIYQSEGIEVQALQGLDLLVEDGELVAIVGASGSGKSTLLSVLSGPRRARRPGASGWVRGTSWRCRARSAWQYRRSMVGFVWQQTARNVVPYLTATENVAFPLALAGVRRKERDRRAAELLDVLGVGYCADRRPGQMSGGEQQRVAIAVALANAPAGPVRRRAHRRARLRHLARRPRGPADRQPRAGHHGRRRHPRPGRERARAAHRGHPRRAHQLGGRAAHAHPRGRHRARGGRGARGARPRRPRAAAEGVPRHAEPGRAACGSRSRSRTCRSGRTGRCPRGRSAVRRLALGRHSSGRGRRADHHRHDARRRPLARRRADDRHDHRPRAAAPSATDAVVRVEHVSRTYGSGTGAVHALRDVSFTIAPGELVALVGRSGSGKTTLLNVVGGLDRPDEGRVVVDGREVSTLDERGLVELRRDVVSFVFQTFGLVPVLSAAENVGVPLRLRKLPSQGPRGARPAAARPGRASARTRCSGPASCPAASSSASRSPARWPTPRACWWPTSRPASWTPRPARP